MRYITNLDDSASLVALFGASRPSIKSAKGHG